MIDKYKNLREAISDPKNFGMLRNWEKEIKELLEEYKKSNQTLINLVEAQMRVDQLKNELIEIKNK